MQQLRRFSGKYFIGRFEYVGLPELNIPKLKAKVDTGAYRSAIHYTKAEEVMEGGVRQLEVIFLERGMKYYTGKPIRFDNFTSKTVKNSFGQSQTRYLIQVPLQIGDAEVLADITLSNRSSMKFPILLGRTLLRGNFLVDVARKYMMGKPIQ